MSVKQTLKELEKKREGLAKLQNERSVIETEQSKLKSDRAEALKRCEREGLFKTVSPFDKKLSELALRVEHLDILILEAQGQVRKA